MNRETEKHVVFKKRGNKRHQDFYLLKASWQVANIFNIYKFPIFCISCILMGMRGMRVGENFDTFDVT